jgi:cytochrome b6-f complex iron-sulfur subunit
MSEVLQEQAKPEQKKAVAKTEDKLIGTWFNRRDFLSFAGWWAFFGFFATMMIGSLRFMFPRVLFEPSPIFKAGFPDEYPPGTVSDRWKSQHRVWIARTEDGTFYALSAICTHLGCTPIWLSSENKFKCPCHGSGFRGLPNAGINFEGPAPRPLERFKIVLSEDGQLLVDKSIKFLYEKGEWGKAGSYLKV